MKPLLFLLFFSIFSLGYSQVFYKVNYLYILNDGNECEASLIYNAKSSLFFKQNCLKPLKGNVHSSNEKKEKRKKISVEYIKPDSATKMEEVMIEEENLVVDVQKKKIIFVDSEKKSMTFSEYNMLDKKTYKAMGPLPSMDWVITDEKKTIAGYICQKATTTFQCRDYEAWFTKEIPLAYGPWKLHGLPGIILEVKESTGFLVVKTKSVTKASSKEFHEQLENLNQIPTSMSIEESDKLQKTMHVESMKKILEEMDMPANGKITIKAKKTSFDLCGPQSAVIRASTD